MNEDLSDFLKYAYNKGKVKDVKEAFEEYPVEEEWHKGDIELVVNEESNEYNLYSIGDIVFVKKFIYEDGSEVNNHLFVIVDQNNIVVPIESFGMLISSQLDKLKYRSNKIIYKNEINGLNKDSIVKTDVIYKIENSQILFKIGKVDSETIEEYKRAFLNEN